MIDRVVASLGRRLLEVPVGFKWFVDGLLAGACGFACEESAGATFLRRDGTGAVTVLSCGSLTVDPAIATRRAVAQLIPTLQARELDLGHDEDEIEAMFERGFTDGLPVVPPTPERVARMLSHYEFPSANALHEAGLNPGSKLQTNLLQLIREIEDVPRHLSIHPGGFLLGLTQNLSLWQLSGRWQDVVVFGALLIFLVFRPQGLFGHMLATRRV